MRPVTTSEIQCPVVRADAEVSEFAAALEAPLDTADINDARSAGQHHAPIRAGIEKARVHKEMHRARLSSGGALSFSHCSSSFRGVS